MTKKSWWSLLIVILLISLGLEFTMHRHDRFVIEATPFFHAWYGFIACAAIVIFSKLIGVILKRPCDYYEDEK